ncbi:unnamed protein product [Merluccius merluccius]
MHSGLQRLSNSSSAVTRDPSSAGTSSWWGLALRCPCTAPGRGDTLLGLHMSRGAVPHAKKERENKTQAASAML